jgi:hypothetical protein
LRDGDGYYGKAESRRVMMSQLIGGYSEQAVEQSSKRSEE